MSDNAIDIYTYRTMLAAIQQMKRPRRFLRDTFFARENVFETEAVDVDIYKGKRKLAPFCAPIREGKIIRGEGFTTNTFKPGYTKPKDYLLPNELFNRLPGDVIYAPGDSAQLRAQQALGRKLANLEDMIARREEYMAAEALTSGMVTVKGDGVDYIVDFGMSASHKIALSGGSLWSADTSQPLTHLASASTLIARDSGHTASVCVMGSDAASAFINHAKVADKLNVRRMEIGLISPKDMGDGVSYIGSVAYPGVFVDCYTYNEWYIDPVDGTEKPMIPANMVIMGSPTADCEMLYGAIQDMDAGGLAAVRRFPKSWVEKDPSLRWIQLQSAPLAGLKQPDAFAALRVV